MHDTIMSAAFIRRVWEPQKARAGITMGIPWEGADVAYRANDGEQGPRELIVYKTGRRPKRCMRRVVPDKVVYCERDETDLEPLAPPLLTGYSSSGPKWGYWLADRETSER